MFKKEKQQIREAIVIFVIYIMTLCIFPNVAIHVIAMCEENAQEEVVVREDEFIGPIQLDCNVLDNITHVETTCVSTTVIITTTSVTTTTVETTPPLNIEEVKEQYADGLSYDMDVTRLSGGTKEQFKLLMNSIDMDDENDFYTENSDIIYDICKKYSINEIFFCGIISAESWWGTAENAISHNNFTGMMGSNGLSYYESTYQNLDETASNLANNYLTEGGKCYYGKQIADVAISYCGSSWTDLVWERMMEIVY